MSVTNIGVVDYGAGNLRSLMNSLEYIGVSSCLFTEKSKPSDFSHLILPGVGAFDSAINNLKGSVVFEKLEDFKKSGKPILGVCLGMQMLCLNSEEGSEKGLSWIDVEVKNLNQLQGIDKVPHMGWNSIHINKDHPVFSGVSTGADVYFVHSYGVIDQYSEVSLAETGCGSRFSSIVEKDNVIGMQFHPEKSQNIGLRLLKNFCEWSL